MLGRDAPDFEKLVRSTLPRLSAVLLGEEQTGTSEDPPDGSLAETLRWDAEARFLELQVSDPTLTVARDNITIEEGQILDERRAVRVLQFEKETGTIWWMAAPEKGRITQHKQLVVPEPYRSKILEQAHGHPWAGHQGCIRTLSWVLYSFFWPSV